MSTIVVGVDNSPQALVAARRAAALAKAIGAELRIVTAISKNETYEFGIGSDRTVIDDRDLVESSLNAIAEEFGHTVVVSTCVVKASPSEALCAEAERVNASVIVVGNKRVKGMGRVLGSIAGDVAKDAPCDVYVVHTYD